MGGLSEYYSKEGGLIRIHYSKEGGLIRIHYSKEGGLSEYTILRKGVYQNTLF